LEAYIEGWMDLSTYQDAALELDSIRRGRYPKGRAEDDGAWTALYCAVHRRWLRHYDNTLAQDRWRLAQVVTQDAVESAGPSEASAQSDLVREVFGSPFRPVRIDRSWLTWNGGMVGKLAVQIYDEAAFDELPILADALEESGCTNQDILQHCRHPDGHDRGCWPLDLILGKM
jgi:hypothetical protein